MKRNGFMIPRWIIKEGFPSEPLLVHGKHHSSSSVRTKYFHSITYNKSYQQINTHTAIYFLCMLCLVTDEEACLGGK